MSRSFHQTIKSVLGGRSKRELDDLAANPDEDVLGLVAKIRTKRETRQSRAASKQLKD